MNVMIIGGGIGGLATALSLHANGISCRIYESVSEIREIGVGINLLPHAVRELTELGLQDRLRAVAIETSELLYFNKLGQQIWREPRGIEAGYNWPQFSIHRGATPESVARCGDRTPRSRCGTDWPPFGQHPAECERVGDRAVH